MKHKSLKTLHGTSSCYAHAHSPVDEDAAKAVASRATTVTNPNFKKKSSNMNYEETRKTKEPLA